MWARVTACNCICLPVCVCVCDGRVCGCVKTVCTPTGTPRTHTKHHHPLHTHTLTLPIPHALLHTSYVYLPLKRAHRNKDTEAFLSQLLVSSYGLRDEAVAAGFVREPSAPQAAPASPSRSRRNNRQNAVSPEPEHTLGGEYVALRDSSRGDSPLKAGASMQV